MEAPRCGNAITFSVPAIAGLGKSVTYFATLPLASAALISSSFTRTSLAKFRILTPSFIMANASAFNIPFVAGSAGTWIVI